MYLLILFVLVILILLYFALDNVNVILNLFKLDLEKQKPSKSKKSSKNVKKIEKAQPVDRKLEIIQRYLNFPVGLPSIERFLLVAQSCFSAFKNQLDYSAQDVRYVCHNVRDFWLDLIKGEEGEIVSPTSNKIRKEQKLVKSAGIQKVVNKSLVEKIETGKHKNVSGTQKTEKVDEKKSVKFMEKLKDKELSVEPDIPIQNIKGSNASTKFKTFSGKDPSKLTLIKNKETKNNVKDVSIPPSASTVVAETNKNKVDDKKQSQEKGKKKSFTNLKDTQKIEINKCDQTSLLTDNDETNSEKKEWTSVDSKSSKFGGDKSNFEKKSNAAISEKQNVITLEKNSRGKKQITIEQNEQSGIKTVLVKKTKQTVYKQTENKAEKCSIGDAKENDKSIGKLSFEELELLVKSFSAKGDGRTENMIDIIQQIQNVKNHMEDNTVSDKDTKSASDERQQKITKALTRAKTTGEISSKNLLPAKEKVKRKLSEESLSQINASKDSPTENAPSDSKYPDKSVDIDPLLQKLEKIKNQDFDKIGKLSFDELGKIVNTLLRENLVPVPKFSEPPYRRIAKKRDNNGNEQKLGKQSQETMKDSKKNIVGDSRTMKQQRVKNQPLNEILMPKERLLVKNKPVDEMQPTFQSVESNVLVNDNILTDAKNKGCDFPDKKDTHFMNSQNVKLLSQQFDQAELLLHNVGVGLSDLSEDMILCEKNTVKTISALLEEEPEALSDLNQENSKIQTVNDESFWPITPSIEHSRTSKAQYLAKDNLDVEGIPKNTEENIQIHDATLYEATNDCQFFQEEKELELKIDQMRKAVVQELKENFETLADKEQINEFEFDVPVGDINSAIDYFQNIENNNILLENTSDRCESLISNKFESPKTPDDGLNPIFTKSVENLRPEKELILFEHTEQIIQNEELDEVSTSEINLELSLPENDIVKNEIGTSFNCELTDNSHENVENSKSHDDVSTEKINSKPDDVDISKQPIDKTGEYCISPFSNQICTDETCSKISSKINTRDFIKTPSNETLTEQVPDGSTLDIDKHEETKDFSSDIPKHDESFMDIANASETEVLILKETTTEETSERTPAEITEASETESKSEPSSTNQTTTETKTFVRPMIRIDRCGDNGIDEEAKDFPTRFEEVRSSSKMVIQQQSEVRVLTLQDNQHQDGVLYRLRMGWTLEFRLGESLFGRRVTISCNIPPHGTDSASPFQRSSYRDLEWANATSDDTANYIRVPLTRPGSYHYFFTFPGSSEKRGSGYVVVDPSLTLGGEPLPLDAIQCVTVLARCLGPFPSWERKLQVARETGYNMVHFTPVQELGGSNSCYSLASQLDLNPVFSTPDHRVTWDDLTVFTEKLRTEWKMLSICDIVLNHTANETPWLLDHPEASYNLVNSPHLKPAYLLDVMLQQLSEEVAAGSWEMNGVPRVVHHEDHLNALRHLIHTRKLPEVRIPELFALDTESLIKRFQERCRTSTPVDRSATAEPPAPLTIEQDPEFRRLGSTVNFELALKIYNVYRNDCFDEDARIKRCVQEFKAKIDELNNAKIHETQEHLNAAVENVIAGVRYYRVSPDGPRLSEISAKTPLICRYFTDAPGCPAHSLDPLVDIGPEAGAFVMSHNGWVMGADPLGNFAAPGSNVYLRRELIAWGDSVKLRFGQCPANNPWLWSHMKAYVEMTARVFDGIRLDNCHSTPLPVAEYLLDAARDVRPGLYVVAELFTNSPESDNIFVNRLAITSLIREAMSAWDSHELGRLVYRYGGAPIGAFIEPPARPLTPSIAHALLLDLSHDNPCPLSKRTVFDLLPSGALVCMSGGASGSNTGYDSLVPHQIDVVDETRQYPEWERDVSLSSGIIAGKRALNRIHSDLGLQGYTQLFVDQVDSDIVAVTRHHPISHESVLLVAFTCFNAMTSQGRGENGAEGKGITVAGQVSQVILETGLRHVGGDRFKLPDMSQFSRDPRIINGISDYQLDLEENIAPSQASFLRVKDLGDGSTRLDFTSKFKPGCVLAVRVSPMDAARSALSKLSLVFDLSHNVGSLSLADLNKVLYCCAEEDGGTYNVPGSGSLVYCGLQGILSLMTEVALTNDLGHPVCANLRDGPWLPEYISGRLRKHPGTAALAEVLHVLMEPLKSVPPYLVPCYFHLILTRVMEPLQERCFDLMSDFVRNGSLFVKALALTSTQMGGIIPDAPLPPLSASLLPPLPPQVALTCAAGLPHFATGYMRNWGRDTFIALRGLFLLTGRYQEARFIILGFAGTLRHGLIPNLLDGGHKARYNCRDAVWWWLYTLQCYVQEAPGGLAILQDRVNRLYPRDDDEATSVDQPLYEVVQEAVQRHFQGVVFRERNAGTAIDAHMVSQGFDNQIGVHPVTGFVFGGNQWNCGTWMDKMGSSARAGTKGRPASPRDGSPVELVGLSKATVRWLADLHRTGDYPYSGVTRTSADGTRIEWSFAQWSEKIQAAFEPHFHIPLTGPLSPQETRPDLVNRRGIYKDTYGSSQPWADYQLRCNYPIAMLVAPELFTPSHARTALSIAEATLLGPGMGMRTLDPSDWSYRGDYNNDNDSDDATVAHGFNYHNGPEWLWPVGFFLRAQLLFSTTRSATIASIRSFLARHYAHITSSAWRGLPELTNRDGKPCAGSCATQAWSGATVLEVMYDISKLESEGESQRE